MSLDPIAELLGPFLDRMGMTRPDVLRRLVKEWPEMVGEPWASRSRPSALSRGELIVGVATGADASLLRYRTGELLEILDRELGESAVETIRIRVQPHNRDHHGE